MSQQTIQNSIVRSPKTLTIASGVITVTDDYHLVAGEGAANDDLVTINGGAQGARLLLRASSDSVTITVKHGSGNIKCHGATDIALAEDDDFVMLVHNGTSWAALPFKVEVDPSLGKAELRTATLAFADSVLLGFGNTAAAPDITVTWNGTKLVVAQATADSTIDLGVSGAGVNLQLYGDTAGYDCAWDQTANTWFLSDNAVLGVGNSAASPDLSVVHNGTNTLITSATGNLVIDNTSATGATFLDLGTNTSATKWAVRSDSGTELVAVTGDAVFTSVSAMTTTDGVASGTARKIGGVAACITAAGTSHTGSTDEAVLASYSIPANTIKLGTVVRCRFLARVTADNGATTLTGRLRLGTTTLTGTELIVSSAVDTSSGHIFEGEFVLVGRAAPGAAAAVVGCGSFADPGAAGGTRITANLNSTNFATNGALRLELTADWSAADANAVQAEIFVVEVIG